VPEGDGISGSLPFIPSTGPPTIPLPPSVSTTVAPTTTPAGTTAPTTTTIVAPAVTTPSPAALNTVPVPVAPTTVAAPTIKSEPTTMPTTTSALPPPPPPPVIAPLVSNNTFYSAQPTPTTMQVPSSSAVTTAKRKAEEALEQATAGTSNAVKPPPSKKLDTSLTPTSASAGANGSAPTKALTDQQKVERRERNRKHAKRSRLRKKFLLESLQEQINGLQDEIESLKDIIKKECPDKADSLLQSINGPRANFTPLPMPSGFGPVKTLMEPDFRLMSALSGSQQNFAISDPSLPDNPIVYVSQGFLELTGYTLDQVLGRNCRFLQGPGTDQSAVDIIRKGVREGVDTSVCLLNYKADGTPFWNQFFVAALRDAENNVVNFVGVQCEVSKAVVEKQMAQKEAEAEKAQKEE
jgi:PAS domain S-box-containing protein